MIDLRSIFALWRRNTKIAEILTILLTTNELFTLWNKNRSKITHIFERKKSNYLQLQYHNLFIEILDYIILTKWSHFHDFKSFFKLCKLRTQKSQRIPSPTRLHIRHSRQFAIRSRAQSGRSIYFSSIDGVNSLYIEYPRHRVSLRQA